MLKTNQRKTKLVEFSQDAKCKKLKTRKKDFTLGFSFQCLHFAMASHFNDTTSLYNDSVALKSCLQKMYK